MLTDKQEIKASEVLGEDLYNKLLIEKKYFAVSDTSKFLQKSVIANSFLSQHIQSFILAPVVKNGMVLGILEVVSLRVKELNSINAQKLDVVLPFLTDTIERLLFQLENQIQAVIHDNYTTIHGSVSWKFRDEAKNLFIT